MVLSEDKKAAYSRRVLTSRLRLLSTHGFFGLLLMHMKYSLDETVDTACTDGQTIIFGPTFLDEISDNELDFVMMHEIMHVALQHCLRGDKKNHEAFNIACDIVVNSNILLENNMNISSITLKKYGESMHLVPNGDEGHKYTAEEVYKMLPNSLKKECGNAAGGNSDGSGGGNQSASNQSGAGAAKKRSQGSSGGTKSTGAVWDDHSKWGKYENDPSMKDVWAKRVIEAAEAISVRDPSNARGMLPRFAQRILQELAKPQTDWKTILNDFIQEEICDYSFSPPDRRFDDGAFFLPDFNDKEDIVEDILFMIDTSGSMSDKMITAAYSEIKGAIDQFDGKLKGWLGFFDAVVIEPKPFESEDEFNVIRPVGGGGTSFNVIFDYVSTKMEKLPASIIILTDGYAPFPSEQRAMGIPVLWLLNNEKVEPPWGKIARITVD